MKNLDTADRFGIMEMHATEPLFQLIHQPGSPVTIKETVVMLVLSRLKDENSKNFIGTNKESVNGFLQSIFYVKQNAEDEAFKINKISYHPKVQDYKGNLKKALKILCNLSDNELLSFVQINAHKIKDGN